MAHRRESVVLLIHCKDRRGIVARVSGFIHDLGGNILDSEHHTDEETNEFLMRMEFATEGLQTPPDEIAAAFACGREDLRDALRGSTFKSPNESRDVGLETGSLSGGSAPTT